MHEAAKTLETVAQCNPIVALIWFRNQGISAVEISTIKARHTSKPLELPIAALRWSNSPAFDAI